MKFGYAILYVEDIEGAVSFYEEAFGLKRRFVHESGQYAEMETGQTTLTFASAELGESTLQAGMGRNDPAGLPAGIEIAFIPQNVDAAFETATKAGAEWVAEPTIKPWGQKVAYVRDLDGVLVEIGSET
jgi:lactoylglutathione lyase